MHEIEFEYADHNLGVATIDPDLTAPCLVCQTLEKKFVGTVETDRRIEQMQAINETVAHTLGPECQIADAVQDRGMDLDAFANRYR